MMKKLLLGLGVGLTALVAVDLFKAKPVPAPAPSGPCPPPFVQRPLPPMPTTPVPSDWDATFYETIDSKGICYYRVVVSNQRTKGAFSEAHDWPANPVWLSPDRSRALFIWQSDFIGPLSNGQMFEAHKGNPG